MFSFVSQDAASALFPMKIRTGLIYKYNGVHYAHTSDGKLCDEYGNCSTLEICKLSMSNGNLIAIIRDMDAVILDTSLQEQSRERIPPRDWSITPNGFEAMFMGQHYTIRCEGVIITVTTDQEPRRFTCRIDCDIGTTYCSCVATDDKINVYYYFGGHFTVTNTKTYVYDSADVIEQHEHKCLCITMKSEEDIASRLVFSD